MDCVLRIAFSSTKAIVTASQSSPSLTRRLITVLFIGQGLALIALFTTAAIGSISGVRLAGTERVAGWPSTAQCWAAPSPRTSRGA